MVEKEEKVEKVEENERQRSVNLFLRKREQKEEEKGGMWENPPKQKDEKDNKHKSMIFNI